MQMQTMCAEIARRTGEPIRLVRNRGFQMDSPTRNPSGGKVTAVDCPFCGQKVLVAPVDGFTEAECRGCETSFTAAPSDVYLIALDDVERPRDRQWFDGIL